MTPAERNELDSIIRRYATARVLLYRAGAGLIDSMTEQQCAARYIRASDELTAYLDKLEGNHENN